MSSYMAGVFDLDLDVDTVTVADSDEDDIIDVDEVHTHVCIFDGLSILNLKPCSKFN